LKAPGANLTVILILTLGIGAMSAMFSLVEGILLRRCRSAIRNTWFWWGITRIARKMWTGRMWQMPMFIPLFIDAAR
jgi:hypothetical protein